MAATANTTPFSNLEAPLLSLKAALDTINMIRLATTNRPEVSAELSPVHTALREVYEDLGHALWQAMADAPTQVEIVALRAENASIRKELEILYENSRMEPVEAAWRNLAAAARAVLAAAETSGALDIT